MPPHFDTIATFVALESELNYKRAAREALVDEAIAARRSAAKNRPTAIMHLSLRRGLDAIPPLRWMILRLSQS